jgi:hypothetical protein
MKKSKMFLALLAAAAIAAFTAGGCDKAAEMANKALDKADQGLSKKAAYEYMVALMSKNYGKMYDLSSPELQDAMEKKAKQNVGKVKPASEQKRVRSAGGREMVVAVATAAAAEKDYPKMSDFSIQKDSWTFAEKRAECVVEVVETQKDNSKTTKKVRMIIKDVGKKWVIADLQDLPAE